MLSGGNANSPFNSHVFGGNANSSYNDLLFGGNSNSSFKLSQQDIVFYMNLKLDQTDCWSGFNEKHEYYVFLVDNSKMSTFYFPENLPPEPKPSDNPILSC